MTTITALYCKNTFFLFLTEQQGDWVKNINTEEIKSFGVYQCVSCRKIWSSSRSRSNFTQICKKCNNPNFPLFIWKNNPQYNASEQENNYSKKHETLYCECCHLYGEEYCKTNISFKRQNNKFIGVNLVNNNIKYKEVNFLHRIYEQFTFKKIIITFITVNVVLMFIIN